MTTQQKCHSIRASATQEALYTRQQHRVASPTQQAQRRRGRSSLPLIVRKKEQYPTGLLQHRGLSYEPTFYTDNNYS